MRKFVLATTVLALAAGHFVGRDAVSLVHGQPVGGPGQNGMGPALPQGASR
ncbi:hypothetical protein SLH49_16360 [Cognatiyoonia sp. IB215446]|uniref:hypothetical protein n=1 Tax=Cognatiyoonia sp. IB215446 TaxID=3097355 RepID=UPI002A147C84|nr:hypothetical protein [Cognatiyoonia sp. IB215446]MDX8349558.1 hypothetical protein [Cognatiyoonia sp. IB215446]